MNIYHAYHIRLSIKPHKELVSCNVSIPSTQQMYNGLQMCCKMYCKHTGRWSETSGSPYCCMPMSCNNLLLIEGCLPSFLVVGQWKTRQIYGMMCTCVL